MLHALALAAKNSSDTSNVSVLLPLDARLIPGRISNSNALTPFDDPIDRPAVGGLPEPLSADGAGSRAGDAANLHRGLFDVRTGLQRLRLQHRHRRVRSLRAARAFRPCRRPGGPELRPGPAR